MKKNQRVMAIMQARMSSTRLPGKVLQDFCGMPMLSYELGRLKQATILDRIVVATSTNSEDAAIERLCKKEAVACIRGSLDDVLQRFVESAKRFPAYDVIVRVTGDCPLIDPKVLDDTVRYFLNGEFDYVSNVPEGEESFPDGMDVEVFTRNALLAADEEATLKSEREHVTPFIRNGTQFKKGGIYAHGKYGEYRLTVDTKEDLTVARFIAANSAFDAGFRDYITLLDAHPEIRSLNTKFERNEGLKKSLKEDGKK